MISTAIFDIVLLINNKSMKTYSKAVSSAPENILPPKNSTISFKIFGLLLSNTQILLVTYANSTDKNQAMIFEIM